MLRICLDGRVPCTSRGSDEGSQTFDVFHIESMRPAGLGYVIDRFLYYTRTTEVLTGNIHVHQCSSSTGAFELPSTVYGIDEMLNRHVGTCRYSYTTQSDLIGCRQTGMYFDVGSALTSTEPVLVEALRPGV